MDLRWEDRQRAFQATVVTDGLDDSTAPLDVRPYRTFTGSAHGAPPPAGSRLERAFIVVIAGVTIGAALIVIGAPRTLVALVAGLTGGAALFAGLAGPDPRVRHELHEPLLALYAADARPGDGPACVTAIGDDETARLGAVGFGNVIGSVRPHGTVGVFVDDYIVWARTPPRGGRRGDPAFGEL